MIDRSWRSLGGIIVLAGFAFSILVIVLGATTYRVVHEEIEKQLDDRIQVEAEALLAAGAGRGINGVVEAVRAREATHSPDDLGYMVVDAGGRRVGGRLDAALPAEGYTEFMPYRLATGEAGFAQAFNLPITGGGRLVVAARRAEVDQMDWLIMALFASAAVLIVLVGIGSAVLLRRLVNRRLATISGTAEAIVAGDFSRRMPLQGDREFDEVSSVINRMLERIEALLGNLRQLSTDLAHDIRAPLNRVRGSLEAFARNADHDEVADTAIGEIDDLLDLLQGLLGIAEIEGAAMRRRFEPIDLAAIVGDVVEGYQPAAEAAGIDVAIEAQSVLVHGDAALLRRSVANLIDNALLHAQGATRLAVTVRQDGASAILSVADNGIGIPPEERDNVLRRFVRLDRSRTTPGHGLGLNLVTAVSRTHGGDVVVDDARPGVMIRVSLPALPGRKVSETPSRSV